MSKMKGKVAKSFSNVFGLTKKKPIENSEVSEEKMSAPSGADSAELASNAHSKNENADSNVKRKTDLNLHVNVGAGASNASASNNEQINSQVNSKFSGGAENLSGGASNVINTNRKDQTDSERIPDPGCRGEETGSRPPERIQQESPVKDTIACNINITNKLALLLDKASFCHNQEVPLTKNWVNLAEYFEVSEDERLRCQRSSQNSPARNLFEFLRTSQRSFPVKRVTDYLREIGRADLALMLEELCLPDNAELRNLFDNPNYDQSKILDRICLHLDGGGSGNWQTLGKQIGIQVKELTAVKLRQFAKTYSCTQIVLEVVASRENPEVTVGRIKEVLTSISRAGDVCPALDSFSDNTKISTLLENLDALEGVTTLLDDETPGVKSWPHFAQEFGLTREECNAIRPDGLPSPTKELITHLIQVRPNLTVKEFIVAVVKIGRLNDVTKVLKEFFNAVCVDRIVHTVMREMETTI